MRILLFVVDLIGFVAVFVSAVLVALVSSLLSWICRFLAHWVLELIDLIPQMNWKIFEETRISKGNTEWYRVRINNYSFMFGRKVNEEKGDTTTAND